MIIDIANTEKCDGESFEFDFLEDLPPFDYNGEHFIFTAAPKFIGNYFVGEDSINVTGYLQANLSALCMRCLNPADFAVNVAVSEVFARAASDEHYLIEGHEINLDKAVLDNLVLNMPMHILCKESCKGLCPHCGTDLNNKTCNCNIEQKKKNSPFSALDGLFEADKEV